MLETDYDINSLNHTKRVAWRFCSESVQSTLMFIAMSGIKAFF